ncbi:endo-1,3-alpha-glucanase family glycosylhydrolase [Phytomonospora sp. NPDC050363]|uniref:endo-1,3-alpha-glucanase family glycosylhydrolase n=1 Tax=Phytomonospora sp. NPDC050363 TaxID=3155642 RepID=UPI0033F87207
MRSFPWKLPLAALVVVGLAGGVGVAVAEDGRTAADDAAPTVVELPVTADTYASQASPTKVHDAYTWLSVCAATCDGAASSERRSFLTFDVPALPANAQNVEMILSVRPARTSDTTVEVRDVADSWSAAELSWNDQPATGAVIGSVKGLTAGATTSVDVSAAYHGTGAHSFALTSPAGAQGVLNSSADTAGVPPKLTVAYTLGTVAAGPLPFDLPPREVLEASGKKVFAHYFTQFRISIENKPAETDYYTRNYLTPDGEGGIHSAYGGFLRDRPLPRDPVAGDWQLADMVTEVTRAKEAGLDGFTLNLLNVSESNYHWQAALRLMRAAPMVDPDFKIVIMPDMTVSTLKDIDAAGLAAVVMKLAALDSEYRLGDGRLVVSPFKAENKTPEFWAQFNALMKSNHGETVALVPFVLNFNASFEKYKSVSYGFSEMEYGAPALQDSLPAKIATTHNAGVKFMASLSPQDSRPKEGNYYEAENSENLRRGWTKAIEGGADWIQLMTWNDYSENHHFSPSVRNGGVWLDLSSYYLTRFKTGAYPAIVRDTVYVVHRNQPFGAGPAPTSTQTKLQKIRANGGTPKDNVEFLTFLTTTATVNATVGGSAKTYSAPAGVKSTLYPLALGFNGATIVRNGQTTASVNSAWEVKGTYVSQDMLYSAASSGRK